MAGHAEVAEDRVFVEPREAVLSASVPAAQDATGRTATVR